MIVEPRTGDFVEWTTTDAGVDVCWLALVKNVHSPTRLYEKTRFMVLEIGDRSYSGNYKNVNQRIISNLQLVRIVGPEEVAKRYTVEQLFMLSEKMIS